MKRIMSLLAAMELLVTSGMVLAEETNAVPRFRALVGGYGLGRIAIVDQDGKEEWSVRTKGAQIDCWLLDPQTVLYSYVGGVCAVRRDPSVKEGVVALWDRPGAPNSETHGCQPLPDNKVLIGENHNGGRVELIEIEQGTLKETFRLSLSDAKIFKDRHGSGRQVRKTSRGTYLITVLHGDGGYEYGADGTLLRHFPDACYGVYELPDGSYLGSGGYRRCVIGYDKEGKEQWRVTNKDDLGEIRLETCTGLSYHADGSLLIGQYGNAAACLVLLSPDRKRILRSWRFNPSGKVTAVQVLPDNPN